MFTGTIVLHAPGQATCVHGAHLWDGLPLASVARLVQPPALAPALRASVTFAWVARWSALLSFAAARAFAASLLSLPTAGTANVDGLTPDLSEVLADQRWEVAPLASRLPLTA